MIWLACALLGVLWALPTVVGTLAFLLCKAFGWAVAVERRGPALIIHLTGPWARWMQTENAAGVTWYGHTTGPFVFMYEPRPWEWPELLAHDQKIVHEVRHVWQQIFLGPLYIPVYAATWLWGFIRTRSAYQAYRQVWQERDARRTAGEE